MKKFLFSICILAGCAPSRNYVSILRERDLAMRAERIAYQRNYMALDTAYLIPLVGEFFADEYRPSEVGAYTSRRIQHERGMALSAKDASFGAGCTECWNLMQALEAELWKDQ